jgi:hypothetical protein
LWVVACSPGLTRDASPAGNRDSFDELFLYGAKYLADEIPAPLISDARSPFELGDSIDTAIQLAGGDAGPTLPSEDQHQHPLGRPRMATNDFY